MNTSIRTGLVSAALVGGSLLGVTQLAGTASAQIEDETDTTEQVDEQQEPAEDGERRGRRGRGLGGSFEAVAEVLGLEADDVHAQVHDGATLGEIADAQGVDRADVVDVIVQAKQDRIARAVDEGRLTQEDADEKLAELEERVTTRVDEGRPSDGEGFRGRGGPRDAEAGPDAEAPTDG